MKTFTPLVIGTHFHSCGMPLNLDTYRHCPFQCKYCFMKNRVIGKKDSSTNTPNIKWLRNKFQKVYDDKNINPENFIETLLKNRIDLHCGTKCEAFQPLELEKHYTREIVDLCNQYDQRILFTTKSDTYYDIDVDPKIHSFQFSVTNHFNDKMIEPNVPPFEQRVEFYKELKNEGFKVAIRFEPFIPNITNVEECLSYFDDVDHVILSHLMLLPQNNYDEFLTHIKCSRKDFKIRGGAILKSEIFYNLIKNTINYLEDNNYSYSTKFPMIGNNSCCCGDSLTNNTLPFDIYHLQKKYGNNWTLNDAITEMEEYKDCRCDMLFTSNRRNGCRTVEDFYIDRWDKPFTKFNPKNQFKPTPTLMDF